jgi:hypothetical protein
VATTTNRLLWWALVGALLIYAAVAHVAIAWIDVQIGAPAPILFAALSIVSIAIAIGTIVYRRRALVAPIQAGTLDPDTSEGARRAFQPFIVNLACSESVGIFGLVLALFAGSGEYALPFVSAALILAYIHRPTASDLVPPTSRSEAWRDPTPIG